MLNEGIFVNGAASLVKSPMIDQIRRLGRATPDELERAVFAALTGLTEKRWIGKSRIVKPDTTQG